MAISNISVLGWIHTAACVMALVTGAWNLLLPKGTPLHRRAGRLYVAAMLIANLGILAVYRFDIASFRPFRGGPGIFGIFHWEAVTTLALLALAVYAAPRQRRAVWAYIHPIAMLLTYYILVGGLINERRCNQHEWRRAAAGVRALGEPTAPTTCSSGDYL